LDRTGLLDKITASVFRIYRGRRGLETDGDEREGRINFSDGLALALETFRQICLQADKDLGLVILAEYTFLGQELYFCAPVDINTRTSLAKAIREFDEAFRAHKILKNPEIYKFVENTYSTRMGFRYRGMPKDAFHVACAGHIVRIKNILKSPGISLAEKELLEQRRSNMKTAQSVYLEVQKKILV
jgi:hypothetical protein